MTATRHGHSSPATRSGFFDLASFSRLGRASTQAWLAVGLLASSVFAGNFDKFLPIDLPINRMFLVLFVGSIVWAMIERGESPPRNLLQLVLLAQTVWVSASAIWFDTLWTSSGLFALVDEILVPLVIVLLVPAALRTPSDRKLLLLSVAGIATYLSVMSVFQTVGPEALLFPPYLAQEPAVGEQSRAVGPFLQVAANGAAMAMAIPACLLLEHETRGRVQLFARAATALCLVGCLLTLTRSVWLGAIVAVLVYYGMDLKLRRRLVGVVAAAFAVVVGLFAFVPGLYLDVIERFTTQRSIDDRTTTNAAALSMLEQNTIWGVGWNRFLAEVSEYVRQADLVPLTNTQILAHNVILSRAAEVGAVGAALLIAALLLGPIRSSLGSHAAPPQWKRLLLASFGAWLPIAMLTPMGYSYPNYYLWLVTAVVIGLENGPRVYVGVPSRSQREVG